MMVASTPATFALARLDPRVERDAAALCALLGHYARSPEGGGTPLDAQALQRLPTLLAGTPAYSGWLAWAAAPEAAHPIGLINCFAGVSTFRALPLLNVHDLVVTHGWRGRGVGHALLARAEEAARERGCCKITLEVLAHNHAAHRLYARAGFAPYALDPAMGSAQLLEKKFY